MLAKTHWPLTAVHPVFQWAYSMYSEKYRSINALPNRASIALLNDPPIRPRPNLRTTTDPRLKDQLMPVSASNN